MPAEPLLPKKGLLRQQLTPGRAALNARPQLASSVTCNSIWNAVTSPNASSGRNVLAGLAANAPNDVWAVGFYIDSSSVYRTLAEHWDGSAWSIVPTPNVGTGNNLLIAVTAISPADVWAVGYWRPGDSRTAAQPLVEHWNGNDWAVVSTPAPPGQSSTALYSVSADAPNDVWAVGISNDWPSDPNVGFRAHTWALRWDGLSWSSGSLIPHFPIGSGGVMNVASLNGVKALAANDVWMVGDAQNYDAMGPSSADTAFIFHWDGLSWTQYAVPAHPNGDFLIDVQGTASDLWAVGGQNQTYGSKEDNVLIEHWTGGSWIDGAPQAPPPPSQSANLFALGYLTGNNVYAVGASATFSPGPNPGTFVETDQALIEQWNGSAWSQLSSANPTMSDGLQAIAAISASDVWAAGLMVVNGYAQTFTENFCAPPVVTNVAPSSGNAGDTVVITGSGFSRAIDVEFGTSPAFSFHVDSDTQITARSPGHKPGMVDIRVTVQGTSATSSADQFTYVLSRSGGAPPRPGTPFQGRTSAPPPVVPPPPPHPRVLPRAAAIPRAAPSPI